MHPSKRRRQLLCLGLILIATTLPACSKPSQESTPDTNPAAQAPAENPAKPAAASKSAPASAKKTALTPAAKPSKDELQVRAAIESWRHDWQSQNLNKYFSHYDPSFAVSGMTLAQWREYKQGLNNKYKGIEVKISGLEIRMTKKGALATFRQEYRSDKFQGHARKQLELVKKGGKWKIYRENNL